MKTDLKKKETKMKNKNKTKYGVFYKSQGRWTPILTNVKKQPRTFTSKAELNRYVNSGYFLYLKNYVLKSATTVNKIN